ncbi:hypothetical protein PDM95_09575 [Bacillus cereus]|nr:hypothetical protein [Bacillus cereus]MDA2015892.1 hypothetical protein [Bacillus cereus]MDA2630280.1 hypothetical protein [Bacillus cereus]HDR4408562.1 hypothetical protein [Bacillus cereus]
MIKVFLSFSSISSSLVIRVFDEEIASAWKKPLPVNFLVGEASVKLILS